MEELIKILNEISQNFEAEQGGQLFFPEITKSELMDLSGHEKQISDLPSFEYEYVSQSGGISGDDFSGTMIFIYKDIAIKVRFYC